MGDIDSIVKVTRFDGWQWTKTGEREIRKEIRRTLLKCQLHKEQELFEKGHLLYGRKNRNEKENKSKYLFIFQFPNCFREFNKIALSAFDFIL